jgi:hypothetical protein
MTKGIIYIAGLTLIVLNLISFLGGILGLIGFMSQSLEETIKLLNIKPIFPKLIYLGAVLGVVTAPIYIFAGIALMRLRYWARKFLLWFIPLMLIIDISYLYLVGLLDKRTVAFLVIDFIIWLILLNRRIEDQFKKS